MSSDSLVALAPLEQRTALAHAVDVSLGGVRLQCVGLDFKPGELLRVIFTFGEDSVSVVGQCVRAEALDEYAQDVAMCFFKMGDDTRSLLQSQLHLTAGDDPQGRREFVRAAVDSIISVSRANVLDIVAQARNVSLGGIHFVVEGLDVTLGDVIRLTLELDGEPVNVIGQLVRVTDIGDSKQEAALAFLNVDPGVAERLQQELGS